MDTTVPLKFRVKFQGNNAAAGDIKFNVRWGTTVNGDDVFTSSAAAPSVGPNEQEISGVYNFLASSNDEEIIFDTYLDISAVIPEIGSNGATSLWVSFERDGTDIEDTYSGSANIIDIKMYYVAWRIGGYVDNY